MQMVDLEDSVSAFVAHRIRRYRTPGKLIEEIDSQPGPPPPCPKGRLNITVKVNTASQQTLVLNQQNGLTTLGGSGVRIGTSPALPRKTGVMHIFYLGTFKCKSSLINIVMAVVFPPFRHC